VLGTYNRIKGKVNFGSKSVGSPEEQTVLTKQGSLAPIAKKQIRGNKIEIKAEGEKSMRKAFCDNRDWEGHRSIARNEEEG